MADHDNYGANLIIFNASKRELGAPDSTYKKLASRLQSRYRIEINTEPLSFEILAEAGLLILAGPQEMFSLDEFEALKRFM
jgi:intraflagellar transport protein 52